MTRYKGNYSKCVEVLMKTSITKNKGTDGSGQKMKRKVKAKLKYLGERCEG